MKLCMIGARGHSYYVLKDLPVLDDVKLTAVASGDASDSRFRYQQLYQALERIPEKEKVAIVLFYFEDKSIKEISASLDMPAGTVKYHLSSGRGHLKQYIRL